MRHRRTNRVLVRVALVFGVLLFVLSLLSTGAGAQSSEQESRAAEVANPAAHMAVVVTGASENEAAQIADAVASVATVESVTVDSSADDAVVYFLRVDSVAADSLALTSTDVRTSINDVAPQSQVQVGGELIVGEEIRSRFSTSSLFIALGLILAGGLASLLFGWRRGLLAGACLLLAVGVAAEFGAAVAGDFNGTLSTTTLPATLVGSVVAAVAAIRLLSWSDRPHSGDNASKVRSAITELGPEIAMAVAALFILSGVAELLQSGRSTLTVAAIGAAIAAMTVFALLPAGLVLLSDLTADESDAADLAGLSRPASLPFSVPDGARQPLIFLAAGAVFLVALAAFAFDSPSRQFIGAESLPAETDEAMVGERLAAVGDQTAPVRAVFDPSASAELVDQWATAAAELSDIVRVETASGSFSRGGSLAPELTFPDSAFQDSEPVAFAVPSVASRSEDGQSMVRDLASLDTDLGNPRLSGPSVDAASDGPTRSDLVILILVAAILVGVGALITTQSRGFGLTAGVLRLLFGAAAIGLYRLVIPGATGAELALVLAVITTMAALFDFEFLGHAPASGVEQRKPFLLRNPGETSLVGVAFLGLACLMLLLAAVFGGGPTAGRLGFGLLFAALLEGALGGFVSRPAFLGQSGAFHTFVRPMRVALTNSKRIPGPDEVEGDPHWKRVVSDLLQSEYQLQVNPEVAEVSRVFVAQTPLARQAETQSLSLLQAGLRISGRGPKLRRVTTINHQSPISLGVVVEHPARQLVDSDGEVVGVRAAELKRGVLWLVERSDGTYRIAESVELESLDPSESSQDMSFSSESVANLGDQSSNGVHDEDVDIDVDLASVDVSTEDAAPTIIVSGGTAALSLTGSDERIEEHSDGSPTPASATETDESQIAHQTSTPGSHADTDRS